MKERIPQEPPLIEQLPVGQGPVWSVMIPAFNCLPYLQLALEGVLTQDPGEEIMQIEVVDDASTDGDIAGLVATIGHGRVKYFRQQTNVGSLRNFETCINRSKGRYVHLLHGDDLVVPGFYSAIGALFARFPEAGAAFCRSAYIDASGKQIGQTGIILQEPGIIPGWLQQIAKVNLLQPPSMVVKRSVYEDLGSFYAGYYGEDWEMWCRIAAKYAVATTPDCLAMYRVHPQNISAHAHDTGQSQKDISRFIEIISRYLPEEERAYIKNEARKNYANHFSGIALKHFKRDKKKYFQLALAAFRFHRNKQTFRNLIRIIYATIRNV